MATINDPSFGGQKAFTVNFPSGWQFQGTVIAGLSSGLPSPVFRAYSPDGLSEIRLLPAFNWQVMRDGKSSSDGLRVPPEHIYLSESFTAAQFLDRYVRTLGTSHVLDATSVGTAYQEQFDDLLRQMNANGRQNPKFTFNAAGSTAALRIETSNGTFIIEQRLRARVICTLWAKPVAGHAGNCTARLDVLRAPKGQLDALANLVDSHNLTNAKHDDAWLSALLAHINADAVGTHFDPPHQNPIAIAVLYRQAEDFGFIREDGHEGMVRMRAAFQQARIEDWADFALDISQQLTPGGGSEQPGTVHIWSSSDGQRYSTCDPKANPTGVLRGNWTEETTTVRRREQPQ